MLEECFLLYKIMHFFVKACLSNYYFVPLQSTNEYTPRQVFHHTTTAQDTAQIYTIIEYHVKGPSSKSLKVGDECITLSFATHTTMWQPMVVGQDRPIAVP